MAWKTPWVNVSLFFTSHGYVERRMEIAGSFGISGDDGAAVSEEGDSVMVGS